MTVATEEPGLVRRVFRDVVRSLTRKAQNSDGIMVALFLPPEVAAELAQPGGVPVDDLHLTLRIVRDDASDASPRDIERWAADVQRAAEATPVLVGNVSGVGRFNGDQAGGGEDVTYATLDIPGLVSLYQSVSWIGYEDHDDEPDHDFTPHVTLAYGAAEMPSVSTIPVRIDRLTLAIGDERREYLFGGADVAPVEKAEWSAAFVNDLPDACFAVILEGGEKDDDGKTMPRSLRKMPYKDAAGKVDPAHLRNALARVGQADIPEAARSVAEGKLRAAMAAMRAEVAASRGEAIAKAMGEMGHLGDLEVEPAELLADGAWAWVAQGGGRTTILVDDGVRVEPIEKATARIRRATLTSAGTPHLPPQQAGRRRRTRPELMATPIARAEPGYRVLKAEGAQRYTLGVAYPARRIGKVDDGADTHGDYMSAEDLELAAWRFLERPDVGVMHADGTGGAAKVVESYIYRGPTWKVDDQVVEPGDWLVGAVWSEEAWPSIAKGQLTGWSMQGMATREETT